MLTATYLVGISTLHFPSLSKQKPISSTLNSGMASKTEPEIILHDLACVKNVCFSPVVWRIRLMLNYKQVPYRTIFLEFPDIEPTLKAL